MWLRQLTLYADKEWPGRSQWTGYQLQPDFAVSERWKALLKTPIVLGALQSRVMELGMGWRELFASKRVLRDRFDLFTGWGSLLHHHFIEGYFYKGSLVIGVLYDMLYDPPRIVYCGFLHKGKRHGPLGLSFYPGGSVSYEGPWEWDEPQGVGKSYWKNGTLQYEGHFRAGRKEGLGKQFWATGVFEGEWSQGVPHGRGCWTWTDGRKFVGVMKDGKREGFGILFYPESLASPPGIEYEGLWTGDVLNGEGKRYGKDGTLRYEGGFLDGLKHGQGCAFYKKTGKLAYKGDYYMGKKEGKGTAFAPDGETVTYTGDWKDGLFHGHGVLLTEQGHEEGDWRKGQQLVESADSLLNTSMVDLENSFSE